MKKSRKPEDKESFERIQTSSKAFSAGSGSQNLRATSFRARSLKSPIVETSSGNSIGLGEALGSPFFSLFFCCCFKNDHIFCVSLWSQKFLPLIHSYFIQSILHISSHTPDRYNFRARFHLLQKIGPPLHQLSALLKVFTPVVGLPDLVSLFVRQSFFDHVAVTRLSYCPDRNDLCSRFKSVQVIRPGLHHLSPFRQVLGIIV
jgi:hypothetical protein